MTEITYRGYRIGREGDTWVATRQGDTPGPSRYAYFSSLEGLKDSINATLDYPRLERRPMAEKIGDWGAGTNRAAVTRINELQREMRGPPPPPPPTVTIGHKSRVYPWAAVVLGALAWIVLIAAVMAFKHWVFG